VSTHDSIGSSYSHDRGQQPRGVRLTLDEGQVAQLAPLAIEAGLKRQNVLFLASVVPFWSDELGAAVWELQVVRLSALTGPKIVRMIRESTNRVDPSESKHGYDIS
jgi:hypothetical protein